MQGAFSVNPGADTGEPEGHAEAMAAKYDGQTETTAPAEKPASAPESQTETPPEQTTETPEAATPEAAEEPTKDETPAEPDSSDSLFQKYQAQYAEHGQLDEAAYAELTEAYGVSRADVDNYIQARETAAEAVTQAGYAVVGGQDKFQEMAQWAGSNLDSSEKDAFNAAVASGSVSKALEAVRGLYATYTAAQGADPELVDGDVADSGPAGFRSAREMTDAMRDPRYKSDPAYRAEVDERLRATH